MSHLNPQILAVLDAQEVVEAVEQYVLSKRPDLAAKVSVHGVRMNDKGVLTWELIEGDRFHGVTVVERTTVRTATKPAA